MDYKIMQEFVLYISKYRIRVQTLEQRPKCSSLPRIFLKFRLPFMQSYSITRLQFPLRLAYFITINKSQGHTISNRMLLDFSEPSFAHGHLSVALSRITAYYNIMIFGKSSQLSEDGNVIVQNIVYRDLFNSFLNTMLSSKHNYLCTA